MTKEQAIELILAELKRAESIHPNWPKDLVRRASIVSEESGELVKEVNNYDESNTIAGKSLYYGRMETEAIHTGAMALRFLINM